MNDEPLVRSARETRDALAHLDGPLHPEDLAAIRHGGVVALTRRRARDAAALAESLLRAALEALRAGRSGRLDKALHDPRQRLLDLRAAALAARLRAGCA